MNIKQLPESQKWEIYEAFKKKLARLPLTQKQYEQRIKQALEALEL